MNATFSPPAPSSPAPPVQITGPRSSKSNCLVSDVELGVDDVMWASDFPHPDGIWPDSTEYIGKELGHLPTDVRQKIVCENAGKLYGFMN